MGTGSKSSHDSYAVAPAAASDAPETPVAQAPAQQMSEQEIQAKADLLMAMNLLDEMADPPFSFDPDDALPDDPVERYDLFVGQVELAQAAIEKLKEEGASEEEIEARTKELKARTLAYLNSLSTEDLRQIAEAKGFEHPALVGLSLSGQHALVHWLDPAYGSNIPSKQKIQAAALKRYDQLLAGETVGGMTLADLHELEGTEPPTTAGGSWTASLDEAKEASQAVVKAINAYHHDAKYTAGPQQGEALQSMLAAEQKLATADCPELGDDFEKAKAHAKLIVDQALDAHYLSALDVQPMVEEAVGTGQLTETEAKHLSAREVVTLMRPTTPESESQALKALAAKRETELSHLDALYTVHAANAPGGGEPLQLPSADDPGGAQSVAGWAVMAGDLHDLQHATHSWFHKSQQALDETWVSQHPGTDAKNLINSQELTNDFKAWAKEQKLSHLRAVAGELGLDNNATASRAHVQNYIAGCFNPVYDQEAIKAKVAAAAAKKSAAKAAAPPPSAPATTPATPAASPAAPASEGLASDESVEALASKLPSKQATDGSSPTATAKPPAAAAPPKPPKPAKPGSFNAKIQALMADLQHAKATSQDVPSRIDDKEVAGWTFGPGTAASDLGGTYAKTVHAAPDGSKWLFKADHNHGGALGHTEAAASHVLSLGGVASVPVYAHKQADGTAGSIQPMVQGAQQFTASPSQWTQSQVDAVVRSHVGSWLIGEHDGHKDNWLETPSGGLVQIDRGQAFKHFGSDTLSVDYAPSGGGGFTPVHQSLYQAALNGSLAKGVKINPAVAHPVIKKFESVPDAQLRSVLHATAHEGAKAGLAWVPQMRSKAAKTLKIPQSQVTHEQIANAFLDHAVERKNSLRQQFTDFFVKQLKMPSAASLKHGGS
ncbi:hypothetical protein OG800_49405 (plasmid) [Streptomyces sp. NBC_00445]|uniref:hypothetical protein n=1 Tax=Streptomyces sp. NBC_00445 TaxID=2975745 RepID=UPI002E1B27B6